MPSFLAVRITRHAISPRFATRILSNGFLSSGDGDTVETEDNALSIKLFLTRCIILNWLNMFIFVLWDVCTILQRRIFNMMTECHEVIESSKEFENYFLFCVSNVSSRSTSKLQINNNVKGGAAKKA
jgi:hypothetical protein